MNKTREEIEELLDELTKTLKEFEATTELKIIELGIHRTGITDKPSDKIRRVWCKLY